MQDALSCAIRTSDGEKLIWEKNLANPYGEGRLDVVSKTDLFNRYPTVTIYAVAKVLN